jgi:pimeloyl-ACP methyl ester carboxylesterase
LAQLRDRYGHDTLLLDFRAHGRSATLPHYNDHTPAAYVHQLR